MLKCQSVVFAISTLLSTVAAAGSTGAPHWGYTGHEGPQHWGELDKDFAACQLGKEQSPINIVGAQAADLPAIKFSYKPTALKIVNNGHTVQVNCDAGSSMEVGGRKFDLVQFHFHTPSEERVNGKHYDMVWHLVHKDAAGKLGVIGVLVREGKANDVIGAVAANLPQEVGKEHAAKGLNVDVNRLLPASRGYYQFSGSLTTPPCSEGVAWHVMKEPVEASAEQIAKFRTLFGNNARPVQPLNGRVVKASK